MILFPLWALATGYKVNFTFTFTEVAHDRVQWRFVLLEVRYGFYNIVSFNTLKTSADSFI